MMVLHCSFVVLFFKLFDSVYDTLLSCCKFQYSKDGNVTALIWGASPQSRSDRRKDRVETNPEQLAAASAQADISLIFVHLFHLCFVK